MGFFLPFVLRINDTCSIVSVMFCRKCDGNASKSFHQFECPLAEIISNSFLTPTMQMAIRTFSIALSLFDGSIENLKCFLNQSDDRCTIFDFKSLDMKQRLLAIHSLISSDDIFVNERAFEDIFLAAPSSRIMWSSHSDFIKGFLRKQTQIGTLNYHEIFLWPLQKSGQPDVDEKDSLAYKIAVVTIGNGSYPFLSLLNHSCSPNVSRIFIDDKVVLIVTRSIDKGAQLFDSYGYNFTNVPKEYRQAELLKQYRFKCGCTACTNDWPLLPALKVLDKAGLNKAKKACRELRQSGLLNRKKATEKFKELCGEIEKGRKNFPSLEICSMMDSLAAFLELSLKPVTQFA